MYKTSPLTDLSLDKSTYNILIVEDSKYVNNILCKAMSAYGYNCRQAFTLKEAEASLAASECHLIILDLHLPDGEGFDLIQRLQELSDTKIIVLTSDNDKQMRENLYHSGILDYFLKDDQIMHTISLIDRLIETSEKNRNESILVIDDSTMVRRMLRTILEARNYTVKLAKNAKEGLQMLQQHSIDLILLDMELPDMHGLQVLKKIKNDASLISIPVLVISGTDNPNVAGKVLKGGASDFIKKPFITEELVLKTDLWIDYHRHNMQIASQQQFLEEYKDAVDRSAIVVKFGLEGTITYINDRYCDISGYERNELIGKPHDLIYAPEAASAVSSSMWPALRKKNSWSGIIKNRTRDGDEFYTDTVINPIVDLNGNIIEYIDISHDITEIENIRRHLKDQLGIANLNFKEARYLSRQYEHAIDESTILSRTDLEGNIIYVNRQFCETTGYSKEELLGQAHSIVRHPDTSQDSFKEMWNTIQAGEIWKGTMKNRAKDGSTQYMDSVIFPIKNSGGKIIEYMAIRHDVTDIIKIHRELEATQKEIIYRMGEVGETRSKETGNHVKRVAEYSKLLAIKTGLSEEEADTLLCASPMHDIGKVGISDDILLKPGKLTAEEFEIMKEHSEMGYNILRTSKRKILKAASIVAYHHHEKWNGQGYPQGLKGEDIHIYGRITAIADVFDALGSNRAYKNAWKFEDILAYFQEQKGEHFDPRLIDIFFDNLDSVLEIRDRYADIH